MGEDLMSIENKRSIQFTATEFKFLGAALMNICKAMPGNVEGLSAYALLYTKASIAEGSIYNSQEMSLLKQIVGASIKAGEGVYERSQDLEARLRADTIVRAFRSMQEKVGIDNEQQQIQRDTRDVREVTSNFSGTNEAGATEDVSVSGGSGCNSVDPGTPEADDGAGRGQAPNLHRDNEGR